MGKLNNMKGKAIAIRQLWLARQYIVVTDQSCHSSVHAADENRFFDYAVRRVKYLHGQHKGRK